MDKFSVKDIFNLNKDSNNVIYFNNDELPNKKQEEYRSFDLLSVVNDDKYILPINETKYSFDKNLNSSLEINYKDKFYIDDSELDGISVKKCKLNELSCDNLNFFEKISLLKAKEFIVVDITESLKKPLRINYFLGNNCENTLHTPVIFFNVKNNACVTVIESYFDENENNSISNLAVSSSFINVSENATLTLQRYLENENTKIILNNNVSVKGEFHFTSVKFAKSIVRESININLVKKNAISNISSINLTKDNALVDMLINMNHKENSTKSNQDVKFILNGNSKTSFTGEVYVEKNLEKIKSNQLCKSVLLSQKAKAEAKPWLKIFSDGVECSHGATYGELDKQKLFYLLTRGIREVEAKKILLNAFIEEVLNNVKDERFLNICEKKIEDFM